MLGWMITGRCFISVVTNMYCEDKESAPFRNLPFHFKEMSIPLFGLERDHEWWSRAIDYGLLILLTSYNLYMSKIIRL